MKILAISGSASVEGNNFYLLQAIQRLIPSSHQIDIVDNLQDFILFSPQNLLQVEDNKLIIDFKTKLIAADAVIIATPEYTHNIPAVVKNMIEWCTASGEFYGKYVLPITFTPHKPRGKCAMQSLIFSLQALDVNIVSKLSIYHTDVTIRDTTVQLSKEVEMLILRAIDLF